jgi:DNA replication licensing factor MCM4
LEGAVIWGTTYPILHFVRRFRQFLRRYRLPTAPGEEEGEGEGESHYLSLIRTAIANRDLGINLNCRHLWNFLPARRLYHVITHYPQETVSFMDKVVNEEAARMRGEGGGEGGGEGEDGRRIQVRLFNLKRVSKMRNLNPEDVDHLVALRGMVIRCSTIIPELHLGCFRCFMCGFEVLVENDRGRIEEPVRCEHCQAKEAMELLTNRCAYTNKQIIRMQETPDEIPEGETPNSLTLFAFDELTDAVRPGDRVEVTGILRAAPRRVHPRLTTLRSVYKTHVEALHFSHVDKDMKVEAGPGEGTGRSGPAGVDGEGVGVGTTGSDTTRMRGLHLPASRVAEIKALSQDPRIYEKLSRAVAPSIWGMEDVKKGVLCLLFGGTDKKAGARKERRGWERRAGRRERAGGRAGGRAGLAPEGTGAGMDGDRREGEEEEEEEEEDPGAVNCRGDINILLCGDPGTSKSQILLYVHNLAPRGIYTSGKGSSAVGLTASVIRDVETKELVLESGALVLSDQGVCCIDEFDKMSETTRAILHEAMEQQTVSIAKAGIICTLNARTSILDSANPVDSRYNPRLSVVENIQLPPTLLSRFDLIYLVLDSPDEDKDRRLARHLISLYYEEPAVEVGPEGGMDPSAFSRKDLQACPSRPCFSQRVPIGVPPPPPDPPISRLTSGTAHEPWKISFIFFGGPHAPCHLTSPSA